MYLDYYGLKFKPFGKTPDPSMLYLSPKHEEALARMEQAVEDRELLLLTGEIGSGKTTLSRALIDRLGEPYKVALIINPNLTPNQLLRTVCMRLGAEKPKYFRSDLIEQVSNLLFQYYEKAILPVLIIDEAQLIPTRSTFEEIRLLTNFQLDKTNLVSIIVLAQPELLRRLEHPSYEAFCQRIGLRYHLSSLDKEEVIEYIKFRLEKAGRDKPLLDLQAMELVWRYSGGIPRRINNLISNALIAGFSKDAKMIDSEIIMDVAQDLGMEMIIPIEQKKQKTRAIS